MASSRSSAALLPVPNPTPSYWRNKLHHLDSHRSTPDLPDTCDIAVIGSGIAGVSVVYHLLTSTQTKSPPRSILLLEARQLCSGATGRNGGHVKSKTTTLLKTASTRSPADACTLARFALAHVGALSRVAHEEDLAAECEVELRPSYDVFLCPAEAARVEAGLRTAKEQDYEWARDRTWLDGEEAVRQTKVERAQGAVRIERVCSLWPYRFVTGLLERVMERHPGVVNLQTETPVLSVKEENGATGTLLKTKRGLVRAQKVIFATNAYSGALLPEYRNVITPYKGTAAHLARPQGDHSSYVLPPHLGQTYNIDFGGHPGFDTVDYMNPRPDGGIVVGGAKWIYEKRRELWHDTVDDSTLIEPVIQAKYFDGYMQRNFQGWQDSGTETDKVWTGIQGETPDGFPHIGKVSGRRSQWILAGFNGGGNALAFICAEAVAKMALADVALGDTDVDIPSFFETTHERLAVPAGASLDIVLDVHH